MSNPTMRDAREWRKPHRLRGGPLGGEIVIRTTGISETLIFTIKGKTGYYDQSNRWQEVKV